MTNHGTGPTAWPRAWVRPFALVLAGALALALAACGGASPQGGGGAGPARSAAGGSPANGANPTPTAVPADPAGASPPPPTPSSPAAAATTPPAAALYPTPANPAPGAAPAPVATAADGGPGTFAPTASGVLDGKVVAIDPGHNGRSYTDPGFLNHLIFNGRTSEACDTTGTETDTGYSEAEFNWNVVQYLTSDLRAAGATVVLTRTSNTGVGPCVTDRAAIGNNAHANAAVSIHADGGPASGRGFAILEPVADGPNDAIIGPSDVLGSDLRDAFGAGTGEPVSTYDGIDGIQPRDDLGGTNLSTVPKVFIECANMRNATDAALVTSSAWQDRAAQGIAIGLTEFLTGH